jgi:hypothetical protein
MKIKIVLILIGLLVFIQILYIINIRKSSIVRLDNAIVTLKNDIQELSTQRVNLGQQKKRFQTMLKSIPGAILQGFEDPEKKYVEFMDYVAVSDLKTMGGTVTVSERQVFKERPVPLQESEFEFEFEFVNVDRLENFLSYLLNQKSFPLQVKQLKITRIPKSKPKVYIKLALLIPAKIDLPSFSKKVAEKSQ